MECFCYSWSTSQLTSAVVDQELAHPPLCQGYPSSPPLLLCRHESNLIDYFGKRRFCKRTFDEMSKRSKQFQTGASDRLTVWVFQQLFRSQQRLPMFHKIWSNIIRIKSWSSTFSPSRRLCVWVENILWSIRTIRLNVEKIMRRLRCNATYFLSWSLIEQTSVCNQC